MRMKAKKSFYLLAKVLLLCIPHAFSFQSTGRFYHDGTFKMATPPLTDPKEKLVWRYLKECHVKMNPDMIPEIFHPDSIFNDPNGDIIDFYGISELIQIDLWPRIKPGTLKVEVQFLPHEWWAIPPPAKLYPREELLRFKATLSGKKIGGTGEVSLTLFNIWHVVNGQCRETWPAYDKPQPRNCHTAIHNHNYEKSQDRRDSSRIRNPDEESKKSVTPKEQSVREEWTPLESDLMSSYNDILANVVSPSAVKSQKRNRNNQEEAYDSSPQDVQCQRKSWNDAEEHVARPYGPNKEHKEGEEGSGSSPNLYAFQDTNPSVLTSGDQNATKHLLDSNEVREKKTPGQNSTTSELEKSGNRDRHFQDDFSSAAERWRDDISKMDRVPQLGTQYARKTENIDNDKQRVDKKWRTIPAHFYADTKTTKQDQVAAASADSLAKTNTPVMTNGSSKSENDFLYSFKTTKPNKRLTKTLHQISDSNPAGVLNALVQLAGEIIDGDKDGSIHEEIFLACGQLRIVSAMQKYSDYDIQYWGCVTLGRMAFTREDWPLEIIGGHDRLRMGLASVGGVECLMRAINTYQKDSALCHEALRALFNILYCKKNISLALEAGVIDAILETMRRLPDNEEIQSLGCRLCWYICRFHLSGRNAMMDSKALTTISAVMESYDEASEAYESASLAMKTILVGGRTQRD